MASGRTDLRMTVGALARDEVVSVPADADVRTVAETMEDRSVGSVVVEDGDVPVGIVTDRDLVLRLLAGPVGPDPTVDPTAVAARDVMTAAPTTVEASAELPRVLHHMTDAGARRLPVVDADERLVGMLALDDVVVHLAGESAHLAAQLDSVAGVIRGAAPES